MGLRAAILALIASVALAEAPPPTLEFDGKQITLTPERNLGRFYTDSDIPKEIDRLLAGPAPEHQNVWICKCFILRKTDADWEDAEGKPRHTTCEMTDADIDGLEKSIDQFGRCVEAYTGRLLRFDMTTRVVDEPLTKLSGQKGQFIAWTECVDPLIGKDVEEGKVDSVMVFWMPKDIGIGPVWGGTIGGCYKGAGYSAIADIHPGACDVQAYFEVALHEWLHQSEWARSWKMGYTDLPDLHMATQMGYAPDVVSRGWMDYYRDFMSVYHTPRMWRLMRMNAGDPERPQPKGEGGFCREWLTLGPFPNENDAGIDRAFIDEEGAKPDVKAEAGGKAWAKARVDADAFDLTAYVSPPDNGVEYLHAYVDAGVEGAARLWIGSDDGVKAWWNGRKVLTHHIHRGCEKDNDLVNVTLQKGWNRLLLKVDQGFGGWGACARLTTLEGKPLDAKWSAARPKEGVAADESDPLLAADWKPKGYKWSEVADDPWRMLPEWGEAELRRLSGYPALMIEGGEHYIRINLGVDQPGQARKADPSEGTFNSQLTFAREATSLICTGCEVLGHQKLPLHYLLVRPDAAPFFAERYGFRADFLGWVQFERRPAFVVRSTWMNNPPEMNFFLDRAADIELDLCVLTGTIIGGQQVEATLYIRNNGNEEVSLAGLTVTCEGEGSIEAVEPISDGTIPAGLTVSGRYKFTSPAEVTNTLRSLLVAKTRVGDKEMKDVAVVEIRDGWEVTLETKDGRPVDRALSGMAHPLVARVKSNIDIPVKGTLAIAAPEGWLPGGAATHALDLAANGEATFDLPVALPATWEGTAELQLTATPADGTPADLGVKPRSATLALAALPWRIVGPFSNRDRGGFATAYPPEIDDDWSKEFTGVNGTVRAFDAARPGLVALDHADLLPVFPPGEWFTVYASLHVDSPDERPAQLRLGSDDTITAWWNHTQVIAKEVYRPAAPDQEVIPITLRKGDNLLVIKVCQGGGAWGYFFRLTDADGKPIEGLRYHSR